MPNVRPNSLLCFVPVSEFRDRPDGSDCDAERSANHTYRGGVTKSGKAGLVPGAAPRSAYNFPPFESA